MKRRPSLRAALIEGTFALTVAGASLYLALRHVAGDGGLTSVHDHQVAVLADHLGGELTAIERPGMQTFLPWFQEIFCLDRRPVEYVMAGAERLDPNHVPRLVVRGREGTSFSFERVEVQYALKPEGVIRALLDTGPGDGFKNGIVDAYARGVLRDAFGRLTPAEVVLPDRKQAATMEAKQELARSLERHGLEVLELSVSKPGFSEKYEETISRRKVADQDVYKINMEREQLLAGREQALAEVSGRKRLELERESEKIISSIETAKRVQVSSRWQAETRFNTHMQTAEQKYSLAVAHAEALLGQAQLDIAKIQAQEQLLAVNSEAALAQARQAGELQLAQRRMSQAQELADLRRELLSTRHGAAEYRLERSQAGQLALDRALRDAAVLREVAAWEAKGFQAEIGALAANGVEAVRAALVQKLASIRFELAPVPTLDGRSAQRASH